MVAFDQLDRGLRNRCHLTDAARFGRRSEIVDDALDNLACITGRAKVQKFFDSADIRHTPMHIFEAFLVRLIVRNIPNWRRTAGQGLHETGELCDSDLFFTPKIKYLADGLRMFDQSSKGADRIAYVAKIGRASCRERVEVTVGEGV